MTLCFDLRFNRLSLFCKTCWPSAYRCVTMVIKELTLSWSKASGACRFGSLLNEPITELAVSSSKFCCKKAWYSCSTARLCLIYNSAALIEAILLSSALVPTRLFCSKMVSFISLNSVGNSTLTTAPCFEPKIPKTCSIRKYRGISRTTIVLLLKCSRFRSSVTLIFNRLSSIHSLRN